jgi:TonB family protein
VGVDFQESGFQRNAAMGQNLHRIARHRCAIRGCFDSKPRTIRAAKGKDMARLHPYKNPLGTLCACVLLLCCTAHGQAQENARKVLKKAPVSYPSILKSKGIGGVVKLRVYVKPDGSVRDSEVIGGNPILAESAQKSVAQWKFSTGSTETMMEVSVVFDPHESGS